MTVTHVMLVDAALSVMLVLSSAQVLLSCYWSF